jgi:hypothetical protein
MDNVVFLDNDVALEELFCSTSDRKRPVIRSASFWKPERRSPSAAIISSSAQP